MQTFSGEPYPQIYEKNPNAKQDQGKLMVSAGEGAVNASRSKGLKGQMTPAHS
jgi:hypothetical protein